MSEKPLTIPKDSEKIRARAEELRQRAEARIPNEGGVVSFRLNPREFQMVESVVKSTGISKAEVLRAVTEAGLGDLHTRYQQGDLDPTEFNSAIHDLWAKIEKKTSQNMEDGNNADEVLGIAMAEAERNILAHPQLSHIVNSIVDRRIAEERAKGYAPQVPHGEDPSDPNAPTYMPLPWQQAEPVTDEEAEKLEEHYKAELAKLEDRKKSDKP